MLHITTDLFARATGQDYQTASKRLRHTLATTSGPSGVRLIALPRCLPVLQLKKDPALPALFATATPIPGPMPPDAEQLADRVIAWLGETAYRQTHRQAALAPLTGVQRAFAQHIADATESSLLCRHTERLRRLLILDDQITAYVITNDSKAFPSNFRRFALEFALTQAPQKEYA